MSPGVGRDASPRVVGGWLVLAGRWPNHASSPLVPQKRADGTAVITRAQLSSSPSSASAIKYAKI